MSEITTLPVASMGDIATAGELIAKSGMCGADSAAEGFVVMATCLQEGMSLLKFAETYNLIKGKPAIKAESMLARFLDLGGEYEVLEHSPERAALKLAYKKAAYTSELTWAEASKESYTLGKNGQLKDNWSTPRRRSQMLWARAVSDGVRVVCPLATKGCYTPEEVTDFLDAPPALAALPAAAPVAAMPAATPVSSIPAVPAAPAAAMLAAVPAAPVAPAAAIPPAAPAPAASPFDQATPAEGVDCAICPIGKLKGQAWASMPRENLEYALKVFMPSVTDGHKAVIRQVLADMDAAAAQKA